MRVFAPVKNNIGKKARALRFRIIETAAGSIVTAKIEWVGESTATADSLLQREGPPDDQGAAADAVKFLRTELASGPRPVQELQTAAKRAGLAWRTVERAKQVVGVESVKTWFDGPWEWRVRVTNPVSAGELAALAKTATDGPSQTHDSPPRPPSKPKTAIDSGGCAIDETQLKTGDSHPDNCRCGGDDCLQRPEAS